MTILGGAFLPHAPQFFTMPETEDAATVERVRAVAGEIGERLRALKPDLCSTASITSTKTAPTMKPMTMARPAAKPASSRQPRPP